jgi:hypothetical protein
MVTTALFNDSIINPTELKSNQKRWLSEAVKTPVTVKYGDASLAIMNRDLANDLVNKVNYMELTLKFCEETAKKEKKSSVFPWARALDTAEKEEFQKELLSTLMGILVFNKIDWSPMEELIGDWQATAETHMNKEASRALLTKGKPEDYVTDRPLKRT